MNGSIPMTIAAISSNQNSFGLSSVVLLDLAEDVGYSVLANGLWLRNRSKYDIIDVPLDADGKPGWAQFGVECPHRLTGSIPTPIREHVEKQLQQI